MKKNKDELYYNAMEYLDMGKRGVGNAEKMLLEAVDMDAYYVQTHVGLSHVYGIAGNKKKAEESIKKAYELTISEFPKWPKELSWGFLENRAYLRAIQYRADLYWDGGENVEAAELFSLLLKLNQIGRASCRGREEISVGAVSLK